jgi:hypothetical protein
MGFNRLQRSLKNPCSRVTIGKIDSHQGFQEIQAIQTTNNEDGISDRFHFFAFQHKGIDLLGVSDSLAYVSQTV